MIGTLTVNNIWLDCYLLLIILILCGFAVYDIQNKRVPNRALIFFLPVAMMAPIVMSLTKGEFSINITSLLHNALFAVFGALLGGGILLLAGLISGGGIGGGDIKLTAILGFIYGPFGITGMLLVAAPVAMIYSTIRKKQPKGDNLRLAFVPHILLGSLSITAIKLFI